VELKTEWVAAPRSGGAPLPGYLARPSRVGTPLPGIVVIQEIWGVDGHIQDLVQRFAAAGYVALAPDLYAGEGTRPEALRAERIEAVKAFLDTVPPQAWMQPAEREAALATLPEPRRSEVGASLAALFAPGRDMTRYVADLAAAVAFLRAHDACAGRRVGSTGYCMGGALSALLACTVPDLAAAVIYYGAAPPTERLAAIRCPVLGLYGGEDPRISEGVPAFAQAMAAAGKTFTYRIYPGAPHAFFNDTRRSYHVESARDAWARTLGFFAAHLV
jgi:carboxymethylenebutenolidase